MSPVTETIETIEEVGAAAVRSQGDRA